MLEVATTQRNHLRTIYIAQICDRWNLEGTAGSSSHYSPQYHDTHIGDRCDTRFVATRVRLHIRQSFRTCTISISLVHDANLDLSSKSRSRHAEEPCKRRGAKLHLQGTCKPPALTFRSSRRMASSHETLSTVKYALLQQSLWQ